MNIGQYNLKLNYYILKNTYINYFLLNNIKLLFNYFFMKNCYLVQVIHKCHPRFFSKHLNNSSGIV